MSYFEVDKKGLAKLLADRDKKFVLYELWQNAMDEAVKTVHITLDAVGGRPLARIIVEDDSPNGFADLTHAYTLYAESAKKSDPGKAGRFNLGEKLVVAICSDARIITTTGGVRFDGKERHSIRERREVGTIFEGTFPCTRAELAEILESAAMLIPPPGITATLNGKPLASRQSIVEFEATLPTLVADPEGQLKRTARKTVVKVFEPLPGQAGWLYELGIPVVDTGDKWDVSISQKVPLNMDRDNVPPSFLQKVRVAVLNHLAHRITSDDAAHHWVREAASHPDCSAQATHIVMDKRFGEKRVAQDPSDTEAEKTAMSKGYVVVPGGALTKGEWQNAKDAGAILPAGKVTPTPKAYGNNGPMEDVIPEPEWTDGMRRMSQYAKDLARRLMDIDLAVKMTRAGHNFEACYGACELTFNLTKLHRRWFDGPFGEQHHELLIHEFGHHFSGDHLSEDYYEALCMLGAKLVRLALDRPDVVKAESVPPPAPASGEEVQPAL
jgi:hypothetical protein